MQLAGYSLRAARIVERRASYFWDDDVGVEHQDAILSALGRLDHPEKRDEIYRKAVAVVPECSPGQIHRYTKKLVGEDNARRAGDDGGAHKRTFHLSKPDEYGGCHFSGYLPRAYAALFASLLSEAFRATAREEEDRSMERRQADALCELLRWASGGQQAKTGHCSLVVSVQEWGEFDWRAKFGSNVGIDLSLMDICMLAGDNITDYIVVKDASGAVKYFATAARSANFYQRIMLLARDTVCCHPGCDMPIAWCDAHHVIPWSDGGLTHIDNLAPLCRNHHRKVCDKWEGPHVQLIDGIPWWSDGAGNFFRNTSPAAH